MYVTIKSNPKHTVLKSETVGPLTSIEDPEKALAPTLPDSRFGATGKSEQPRVAPYIN